jgi:hypothetical protein
MTKEAANGKLKIQNDLSNVVPDNVPEIRKDGGVADRYDVQ